MAKGYFLAETSERGDKLNIPMCRPIEIGKCDEGVYILQTWNDGKDAEDVVPYLTDSEQYALGNVFFGDSWEEFNRIVWCAQKAPVFATGIVDGYFNNEVPLEFWKLLALYISSNMLSSIPWAIPFGDGEIRTMLEQAKDVLAWYDEMQNPIPTWYRNGI